MHRAVELLTAVRSGRRHFYATDASEQAHDAFMDLGRSLEKLSAQGLIVLSACGRAAGAPQHWLTGLTVLELTEQGLDYLWLRDVGGIPEGRSKHRFAAPSVLPRDGASRSAHAPSGHSRQLRHGSPAVRGRTKGKALSEFANTVVEDWDFVSTSPPQIAQWTARLGVSEADLRTAVQAVGTSIAAVCWHLGLSALGSPNRVPVTSSEFSCNEDAQNLCAIMGRLNMTVYEREDLRDELIRLSAKVCKAICSGALKLDYAPARQDTVSIPAIDHAHHVQALLYWCIRLDTSVPELREACCRMDDDPSIDETKKMFSRMKKEERSCRTDMGSLPPAP